MIGHRWVAISIVSLIIGAQAAAVATLPTGSAPPALEFPHFPDRAHAFVWRNWNVVESARLAAVLGTSAENVRAMAGAMGLPGEEAIPTAYGSRMYLTIIRRNWHLLPYDQLLALLDWTPEHLAETLREDDFFWPKLGNLKPKCERLVYVAPNEKAREREAEIRRIVTQEFGAELARPAEARFAFLEEFNRPVREPRKVAESKGVRFLYSYFAVYGDSLSDPSLDPYPDGLLQKYADLGVNGVWLHVVLRQLGTSKDYPEFGKGAERRIENLKKLVERAGRFGIKVYLYMNEPRAMPVGFFKERAEDAGVREAEYVAMCTSSPRVRRWLSDSLEQVFSAVPELGGAFTITGSENLTNCASHGQEKSCPHCASRAPAQIIAEVNAAIEAGVHRGSRKAQVMVWDWWWADAWAGDVIARLPKGVELMSVSEWSLPISRGGVKTVVGEYSISSVGPGPRATKEWSVAKAAGLGRVAKMQINNSWELSAVPYLPVMDLVAAHCEGVSAAGVEGMMLSWSLGGYPSPNLEIARRLTARGAPASTAQVLDEMAERRYGKDAAPAARRAWTAFSKAFAEYPFDAGVIYKCPVQFGPANLLWGKPTGYSATMLGFPYDDLDGWRGPYPAEVFAGQFEKVAAGWKVGLAELEEAVKEAPLNQAAEAKAEMRFARAAYLHFQSVGNQARFVLARRGLSTGVGRERWAREMRRILREEEAGARELFTLTREDSRVGFEASNHYYYLPSDLMEKVVNCRYLEGEVGGRVR